MGFGVSLKVQTKDNKSGGDMGFTPQEKALSQLQKSHGKSAFTEDHLNYRRVGFRRGETTLSAMADTWDEAMEILRKKTK